MATKVCYINHFGYGLFNKEYTKIHTYSGAETAMHEELLELAKDPNFEVHVLVEADSDGKEHHGRITVWKMKWQYDKKLRPFVQYPTGIRIFTYQKRLWNKLKEVDADVYIQRAAFGEIRLTTALFCRMNGKKYIYVVPGTPTRILPLWKPVSFLRWIVCDKASMQLADKLVAISYDQLTYTPPRTHEKTRVIYIGKKLQKEKQQKRKFFLFIGRNTSVKRPDLFVKLAETLPEHKFVMICPYDKPVPKNVELLPFVPHEKMKYYYSRAIALISLSTEEGFGNVYVEAWRQGTPVIALTTDVDENICKHRLGFHSHTFQQMIEDAQKISDKKVWNALSKNAQDYFRNNHDIAKQIEKYKPLLK
jgi:glycosyltransferase involved in cell wall biosynthesis